MTSIKVYKNSEQLAEGAADFFCEVLAKQDSTGRKLVALSGGRTPKCMYDKLVKQAGSGDLINSNAEIFFSDERAVSPDNPASNFKLAEDNLFKPLGIMSQVVHRMKGEADDLQVEAERYSSKLQTFNQSDKIGIPKLDLIILGLGSDGHTASLFPDYPFEQEEKSDCLISAPYVRTMNTRRLTFTLKLINSSKQVMFMVVGKEKAKVVGSILYHENEKQILPAAKVKAENIIWLLDEKAASKMDADYRGIVR